MGNTLTTYMGDFEKKKRYINKNQKYVKLQGRFTYLNYILITTIFYEKSASFDIFTCAFVIF